MIAQVLHRDTVIEQLATVQEALATAAKAAQTGAPPRGGEELAPNDFTAALAEVRQAEARERQHSSGQPSFPPPATGRRAEPVPPLDDFSFFSRDPVICNVQSALDVALESIAVKTSLPDDERRGAPGRRGYEEVAITDLAIPGASPKRKPGRRIFDRFSITDPLWVSSLVAEGIRAFRKRIRFNDRPAPPLPIPDKVRLVIVGDWGSGLPRAKRVAEQMRKPIDEALAESRAVQVVHLGDVYYSGWKREYKDRFLNLWPVTSAEADRIGSWSLNGNHDMYSGGHDYYGTLLTDSRFRAHGGCSYFSLVNKHWRIVGLDSSYEDGGLQDPQATWLAGLVDADRQSDPPRKLMLLSHHQFFSAYESGSKVLSQKIQPIVNTGLVKAWFWGHEHRCMLYPPHANVAYGRCIGHGGVPVYMSHGEADNAPDPGGIEYRAFIKKGLEKWALFGFAVVDFDGPAVSARYIDENGTVWGRTDSFSAIE